MDFNPWKVKSLKDFTSVVYSCPECEKTFSTSEQFIGHAMLSHQMARDSLPNILNVQDIVPDIRFEEKSEITEKSLVNHDLVEVKQESKRSERFYRIKCINAMYKCNICGKSFRTEYGRRDHLKTCQNQRSKNLKKIMQKHIKLSKHA